MANLTGEAKREFLARMAAGRARAGAGGGGKRGARLYRVWNDASGMDLGNYRASSAAAAIKAMLRDANHKGPASPNLRAAPVGKKAAGAVGRPVSRKIAAKKRSKKRSKKSAGLAKLPGRTVHPRGKIGTGTPAQRLVRVEHAVMDLARVNQTVVTKLVDHEKRIGKVEGIASRLLAGMR